MTKKAFTLIEILVWITLITIIFLSLSRINLKNIWEAQKIWIMINKIKSNIETVINNSLTWKAINSSLYVPKIWDIKISKNDNSWWWTWSVISYFLSWATYKIYSWTTLKLPKFYEINKITCKDLNWSNINEKNIVDLLINNWEITLSWCTNTNKLLNIEVKYKNFKKNIYINSVTNTINSN